MKMIPENEIISKQYLEYLQKEGSRPLTIRTWLFRIKNFDKILKKPLDKTTKEDAELLCVYLDNNASLKEGTRQRFKCDYKTLRRWITKKDYYPEDVSWITKKKLYDSRKSIEKTPEDLPTEQEKDLLFFACRNYRDKALIMLLRETGLRPKELLSLDRRHVSFNEKENINMLTVPSDTKTGKRYVPFEISKPYLLDWLAIHPFRNKDNYPLWIQLCKNQNQRLTYKGLEGIFSLLKVRAGLKQKKLTAYSFRFSSISEKAKQGWSDQELKAFHGHRPDSKMLNVYVQMSGRDLINRIKGKGSKPKDPDIWLIKCPKCSHENTNKDELCRKCGRVLNLAKAQEILEKQEGEAATMKEQLALLISKVSSIEEIQAELARRKKLI